MSTGTRLGLRSPWELPTTWPELHGVLREGLLVSVRSAVIQARTENRSVRTERLRVKSNAGFQEVTVEVIPMRGSSTPDGTCLIVFEDATRSRAAESPATPNATAAGTEPEPVGTERLDDELARLAQELAATREYLQAVIEQQEAANEELQTSRRAGPVGQRRAPEHQRGARDVEGRDSIEQ